MKVKKWVREKESSSPEKPEKSEEYFLKHMETFYLMPF